MRTCEDLNLKKGEKIWDSKYYRYETILDVTTNSVLITRSKVAEAGINCSNWFNVNDKRFKDIFNQ